MFIGDTEWLGYMEQLNRLTLCSLAYARLVLYESGSKL